MSSFLVPKGKNYPEPVTKIRLKHDTANSNGIHEGVFSGFCMSTSTGPNLSENWCRNTSSTGMDTRIPSGRSNGKLLSSSIYFWNDFEAFICNDPICRVISSGVMVVIRVSSSGSVWPFWPFLYHCAITYAAVSNGCSNWWPCSPMGILGICGVIGVFWFIPLGPWPSPCTL